MLANQIAVDLVPQGTFVERIRAGGCGLGGVLTPTGVGTLVEEGKRKIEVDGKTFLLETALRADFALVHAFLADYLGNLSYALTARNFNPVMAMAADTVIVTAEHIVPVGVIAPDHVVTPGAARRLSHRERVNHGRTDHHRPARRAGASRRATSSISASAFRRWSPTTFRPDLNVFFQSENGLIGTGPIPEQGMAHPLLTDAGGRPISALPGACTFDSAMSFGLIRGGHVDVTVLGGLQVDADGHLANWMIPGKMVPGMGGAMDLVTGAKRVIVAMQHAAKGKSKIVAKCTLPLTSARPVDLVVTDMAVIGFPGRQGDAAGNRARRQRRRGHGGDRGRTRHSGQRPGNEDLTRIATMRIFSDFNEIKSAVGTEIGVSDWSSDAGSHQPLCGSDLRRAMDPCRPGARQEGSCPVAPPSRMACCRSPGAAVHPVGDGSEGLRIR